MSDDNIIKPDFAGKAPPIKGDAPACRGSIQLKSGKTIKVTSYDDLLEQIRETSQEIRRLEANRAFHDTELGIKKKTPSLH